MEHRYKCALRLIVSLCCLLFMFTWTAFGQDSEPLVVPSETEVGDFELVSAKIQSLKDELDLNDLNRITLKQEGNMNEAFIQQFSKNDPNLANVHQKGNANFSDLYQQGNGNATDIYQEGYGNSYFGEHVGNDIINIVVQTGDANIIDQDLRANDLDFQINQFGNGHELYQTETRGGIGYKVTQHGPEGMKIKINQGNIYK